MYSPEKIAFRYFDNKTKSYIATTWLETAKCVSQWQAALKQENLSKGDLVGMMIRTSYERAIFEFAASGLGLVTVPIYINSFERPSYLLSLLENTQVKLLLIQNELQEAVLLSLKDRLPPFTIIRLDKIDTWLPQEYDIELCDITSDPDELITIHYTSGTSGKLKAAMLSHKNILSNAEALSYHITTYDSDQLVPFTGNWIFPMMMDFATAFPRSLNDLERINPTHIVSAARFYEYLYEQITIRFMNKPWWFKLLFKQTIATGWKRFEYQQGRKKWAIELLMFPILDAIVAKPVRKILGNRLRCAFYAGGILPPEIYQTFIGLGVPLLHCYGQAEAGAVISMNMPDDNLPSSVGKPLKGFHVRIKKENGELQVKSSSVMMGYWNNPSATESTLKDGWLHTGDMVRRDNDGHLFFIGRISDMMVMKNGSRIATTEIEALIKADILFDQVMVIGKEMPFLTALIVLNKELWKKFADSLQLNPDDPLTLTDKSVKSKIMERISAKLENYPDCAPIDSITLLTDKWTIEDGLVTTSSKLKRANLYAKYASEIGKMYSDKNEF